MIEPGPPPQLDRTRWGIVVLTVATGFLVAFQVGKMPVALTSIRSDLGLGIVAAGWAVSLLNLTTAVLGAPGGVISDRIGHRRLLLGSLALLAAGSALGAAAENAVVFLISRFVESLAVLGLLVSIPAFLFAAAAERHRGTTLAMWSARTPFGMALMIIATPLILTLTGWRGLWLVNAAIALIALVALTVVTRRAVRHTAVPRSQLTWWSSLRLVLVRPGPWVLAASFITYAAMWMAVMVWLPTFLTEVRGWTLAAAAWGTALVVVANVPSNLVCGHLAQRGVPTWILIAAPSLVMGVTGYGIFAPEVPDVLKLSLAVAFSLLGGFLPGAILVAVPRYAPSPDQIGAVNGVVVQGASFGHFIGPPVLAVLVSWSGGIKPAACCSAPASPARCLRYSCAV